MYIKEQKIFFTLILCAVALQATAQNIISAENIKNNPEYYWGEGSGYTRQQARDNARRNLSESIWTVITSNVIINNQEKTQNEEFTWETKQKIFTQSYSMSALTNVREKELSPEPNCVILVYVTKEEIDQMKQNQKEQIYGYVETGRKCEQQLQIDDALRNYYTALMLAKSCIEPIEITDETGKSMPAISYMFAKIKSVLLLLKAQIVSCKQQAGRYPVTLHFTYNNYDVASLTLKYNDGDTYVSTKVRDGYCELSLINLPPNNKISIEYEYIDEVFAKYDPTLQAIFSNPQNFVYIKEASNYIPLNDSLSPASTQTAATIAPEDVYMPTPIELQKVKEDNYYLDAMSRIENAIRDRDAQTVKDLFSPEWDGYEMFCNFLKINKRIKLIGKQEYTVIKADNIILVRPCRVEIRYSNGKTYIENIVFRFLPSTGKIESFAYMLTQKAENCLLNKSLYIPDKTRFAVLRFMEDYQTAYALKRLDYIDKIFSDDAIIITGTRIKAISNTQLANEYHIMINKTDDEYYRQETFSKGEFIKRLGQQFDDREYVHLTFEENICEPISSSAFDDGSACCIQIRQIYSSPVYSDKGYLTLFLNMRGSTPIITVRLWEPQDRKMTEIKEFLKNYNII